MVFVISKNGGIMRLISNTKLSHANSTIRYTNRAKIPKQQYTKKTYKLITKTNIKVTALVLD